MGLDLEGGLRVYDRPDGTLAVVHGHSKEHRPDLKQFLIALLCNREGIPLSAEVQDGNHSDKLGNAEAIDELVATSICGPYASARHSSA